MIQTICVGTKIFVKINQCVCVCLCFVDILCIGTRVCVSLLCRESTSYPSASSLFLLHAGISPGTRET